MMGKSEATRLFCSFRIAGQLFGVDILDVKEVTTETTSTRIAHAPEEMLGLVNIRGHIYLALDLRRLLGMPASPVTSESRLVLFKPGIGNSFGVVVDEISEIHSVDSDHIEAYSSSHRESIISKVSRVELITAICRLPDELLVILDSRRFLNVVEQNYSQTD